MKKKTGSRSRSLVKLEADHSRLDTIAAVSHIGTTFSNGSSTAVALALTAATAQSDPAKDWAPTASVDQADLPEDRASTPAPAPTPSPTLQGAPSPAATAASAPAPTLALASAPARAVAPATDLASFRTSYTKVLRKTDMSSFLVSIGRPSASFFFISMLFHMIHCVDLTNWV